MSVDGSQSGTVDSGDLWQLTAALRKFAWQPVGGIPGLFETWSLQRGSHPVEILVPLDSQKGDFVNLLERARDEFVRTTGNDALHFLHTLKLAVRSALDTTKFMKSSPVEEGLISWDEGEQVYAAARASLASAAKAVRMPRR